jgi:hypothetical protein
MSRSSSPERPVFVAHPLCPPHLRNGVEEAIESFDSSWLLPPHEGEVFQIAKDCLCRLQGYALSRGFAVVTTTSKKSRAQFSCIHHGIETKNWRELENHVDKDTEGNILSRRKKEATSANAKDCTWEMYWSVRSVGKRGSGVVAGQLGITRDVHNHILAPNPFIYKVHQKATPQYHQAVGLALGHRLAHQPYSAMRRVLDTSGLRLDRKTYYNLVRSKPLEDKVSNDSFEELVLALEEVGFRFACSMSDELADDGSVKGRVLEQVFFISDAQITYGKRFIADQVLLIDGTFETNRLGLVLLVVVGVTNTGKNFPAAYSFVKSEARASFDFVFDCLKRFIFTDNIAEARIVLSDQAAGLIASMPAAMPNCKLQHCGWYIAQNIKKRLAEKKYLAEERKGIMNLVWFYIQSSTEAELVDNKAILMASLKASEQNYIQKHWYPRESHFIYTYTRKDANLGCNSTQRAESTHPVTTTLLNHQLALGESVTRLAKGIRMLLRDLDEEESKSYGPAPRTLDLQPFKILKGQVTEWAMNCIAEDWEACKQAVSTGTTEIIANEECSCELLLRYSLPCKHHLLRACLTGTPIPRSLFHPRWWLNGPPISKTFTPWKPQYGDSAAGLHTSQRLNDITATGLQVLTARDGLTGLAKARFDNQLVKTNKALLEFAEQVAKDDLLPTRLPDKVQKPKWAKPKKTHDKASKRSMTGAEAAERAAGQVERAAIIPVTPRQDESDEDNDVLVPGTPPFAGESQGGTSITLAIRTPERLRGPPDLVPQVASETDSSPEPQVQLPASTAPGRIEDGPRKRRRMASKRYTNSQYEL